jgi:NitT/TauT family transport system permease protein
MVNRSEGGIGALAYTSARQSRVDKVFAILVVIIVVGFVQDKFMSWLSQTLFPYRRVRGEK